ncbi:MAG: ATP-binding protein [Candidatus Woesearchaeota archaeon]
MVKTIISSIDSDKLYFELNDLTKHAAILGTTGSGKTVMCKVLIEEALLKGIPVIAIDPKGDISGLGIHNEKFDFRPFLSKAKAKKTAQTYFKAHKAFAPKFSHETSIFTPKSNAGLKVSLMPDLSCPKNFSKINKMDSGSISVLIEPISESVVSLAGISSNKDKVQTLISQIILESWQKQKSLDINLLIKKLIEPDFSVVGSLNLEDFLKEKDRMKAASSINLLLSSPSKKIWSEGSPLNAKLMLKKNSLSVFDLRFCASIEEKQFVVEQILQELYKFLLSEGGSSKLKYILYIDELAGFLPPPPANPASKKLLETLIRQARAFGLGIVVATQNPGDIDYKILGNIGSRFIGKLRTVNDIEKVASATDIKPSELKAVLSKVKTGEFFLNNAIRNKNAKFKSRWLYTLHEGPLKEREISWLNVPKSAPRIDGVLGVDFKILKKPRKEKNIVSGKVSKAKTSRQGVALQNTKVVLSRRDLQKRKKNLQGLISSIKKRADIVLMNVALAKISSKVYTPHLKITIEPKPYKGNELKIQGPYIFDLTSKAIPVGNYLSRRTWSQFVPEDVELEMPSASINGVFKYALSDAKSNLRTDFFESKMMNIASLNQDVLIEKNLAYLKKLAVPKIERMNLNLSKQVKLLEEKKLDANKSIREFKLKSMKKTASRAISKIFANKKLVDQTKEMKYWESRIRVLRRDVEKFNRQIVQKKKKHNLAIKKLNDVIFEKARTQIKRRRYIPKSSDLIIRATILLIPKRLNKK